MARGVVIHPRYLRLCHDQPSRNMRASGAIDFCHGTPCCRRSLARAARRARGAADRPAATTELVSMRGMLGGRRHAAPRDRRRYPRGLTNCGGCTNPTCIHFPIACSCLCHPGSGSRKDNWQISAWGNHIGMKPTKSSENPEEGHF